MPKTYSFKVGDPLPETLGPCVDLLKETSELRLAMQKEVDEIKARESEISQLLLDKLSVKDTSGVAGLKYRAQVTSKPKPSATDWEQIYDFIYENDRFDLLGKSLANKAIEEMWEAGQKVPGVSKVNVKKLSITKI